MEKAVLSERLSGLQTELSAATLEAERAAREAAQSKEQEEVTERQNTEFKFLSELVFSCRVWSSELMEDELSFVLLLVLFQIRVGALTSELSELRSQLDGAVSAHHRELQGLQETCSDLRSRAEVALKEANDSVDDIKAFNLSSYTLEADFKPIFKF